jgi:hypothetical protein
MCEQRHSKRGSLNRPSHTPPSPRSREPSSSADSHSDAIHASGLNNDPHGRIRFSADLRYVDGDQAYDHRWTKWGRLSAELDDH